MAISKLIFNGVTQMDVTGTTATEPDVLSPKKFTRVDGVETTGTGSGGGGQQGWQRPADWPDYSQMTISGEVLYITVSTSGIAPFFRFKAERSGSGTITLERGTLSGGIFTADSAQTISNNTNTVIEIPKNTGLDYLVYRLTSSTTLTQFLIEQSAGVSAHGYKSSTDACNIVEIYGRVPYMSRFMTRGIRNIVSCTLLAAGSLTSLERAFNDCYLIENVKITGLSVLANMYYTFCSAWSLRYIDLDNYTLSTVTSATNMMQGATAVEVFNAVFDLRNCVGNFSSYMQGGRTVANPLPQKLGKVTQINNAFRETCIKKVIKPDWDTSLCTRIDYAFYLAHALIELDISNLDLSSVTTAGNTAQMCNTCKNLEKVSLPSSLGYIGASMFNGCQSIKEVHFLKASPPILDNVNAFSGVPDTCIFYVPQGSLTAYQTANNWSSYASRMQEEP